MNYRKLVTQTIPTVGAISLASCSPSRGGGGGGGGGGSTDGIVGAWELRTYGYTDSEYGYEYPIIYTDEYGCTRTTAYFMVVEEDLEAEFVGGTSYENCEYYSEPYVYRYPGAAQDLQTGLIRLSFEGLGVVMDCPKDPTGTEMTCTYEFEDGGDDDDSAMRDDTEARNTLEVGFQRTSRANVPEPTVEGGDDDDSAM